MNIHEHQAKELFAEYDIAVPNGFVVYSAEEAIKAAQQLSTKPLIVKSQIHAGGRGAGYFKGNPDGEGGIRVANTIDQVASNASEMLGGTLVTKQTGETGKEVKRLYIEEGCNIARELYLSLLVDRDMAIVTLMASTEGGMDIEEVALKFPQKIQKIGIDPLIGIRDFHARRLAYGLGLKGSEVKLAVKFVKNLFDLFCKLDCSLIEINPLVVTQSSDLLALDAKVNFDDNALFRHPQLINLKDANEEDPAELEAAEHDLNYIKLHGNIGCMVNGAGLAMATMDICKLYGGEPANFLDVGGGATKEKVSKAFRIILSDPNVEGILVNIFGGIMRCDTVAEGVVEAAKEISLNVPLVVRLEGTNVEKGNQILAASGLPINSAKNLDDAAKKIVQAVKKD